MYKTKMKKIPELVKLADRAKNESEFVELVANYFNEKNLATILEKNIGEKLCECFRFEKTTTNNRCSTKVPNLNKYLMLANELLPNLPSHLNEKDSKNSSNTGDMESYNQELIGKFAANIIVPLYEIFKLTNNKQVQYMLLSDVYLKMLFFADINILLTILGRQHIDMIKKNLFSKCMNLIKIFSKAVVIITERLPEFSRKYILTQDIIFKIRQLTSELKYLDNFCVNYKLEYDPKETFWGCFIKKEFEKEDFESAFMAMSEVFEKDEVMTDDLINLRLIDKLTKFIKTSLQNKNDNNMKLFLTKFVRIRRSDIDKNEIDSKILKNLVKSLVAVVNYFFGEICNGCDRSCYQTCSERFKEFNENSINILKKTSDLLQYLYLISNTWYQWFNSFTASPLLNKQVFICEKMTNDIESIMKNHSLDINFVAGLVSRCPVMIPYSVRKHLYRNIVNDEIYNNEGSQPKNIIVKRAMTLSEIASKIGKLEPQGGYFKYNFLFQDENATGRGLNKEFLTIACKEYQKYDYELWLGGPSKVDANNITYVSADNGFFPKHKSTSKYESQFFALGKLLAYSLAENYNPMDIPLSVEFLNHLLPGPHHEFYKKFFDVAKLLPEVGKVITALLAVKQQKEDIESDFTISHEQKQDLIGNLKFDEDCSFEDLFLNFTVPGSGKELIENGENTMLTQFNIDEYLDNLGRVVIEEDSLKAITAFRKGFDTILPFSLMTIFLPEELQRFFGGEEFKPWSVEYLYSCCKFDRIDRDSEEVKDLFEVMSTFDSRQQQQFLHFVTGTTRLPIGGLPALNPRLTIAKNIRCFKGILIRDKVLPCAHTCFNKLFITRYSNISITKERILLAIAEGGGSFAYY